MRTHLFSLVFAFFTAIPLGLFGEDASINPNRLSIGPRLGLNLKADFENSATNVLAIMPGTTTTNGINRTYEDGYVRVDSSGNLSSQTSFWGYDNASQYTGGGIEYHATRSGGNFEADDQPQYGAEIVYQRVLSPLPAGSSLVWGMEAGFGYTNLSLEHERDSALVLIDTYAIAVLPPSAGYEGTFAGPGALLGSVPVRSMGTAALSTQEELSGVLFSVRIGPFLEWQLARRIDLTVSVGVTAAHTNLDYEYSEIGTLGSGASYAANGQTSASKMLYGPFGGATLRFGISERAAFYVGSQYQRLTILEQSIDARTARFDPSGTLNLSAGFAWRF